MTSEQLKRWRIPTGFTQRAAAIAADLSCARLVAAELGQIELGQDELERLKSAYLEKISENLEQVLADLLRPPDIVFEAPTLS